MMKTSIVQAISEKHDFVIMPHRHPDGDAVGSSLALALALAALGKNVKVWSLDPLPYDVAFLETGAFWVDTWDEEEPLDYIIALDSSDPGRLEDRPASLSRPLINIDHHKTNTRYGDLCWVDPEASATGEMIHELIESLGVPLSVPMATALYVAISTDTGSFMYTNTSRRTHLIAGDLLSRGIDLDTINRHLYQNISLNKFRLDAYALGKVAFYDEGALGIVVISEAEMKAYDCTNTDHIVEAVRNIDTVSVAVLIVERRDEVKVSMRSKGAVDVSEIALKHQGGGHANAAGFSSSHDLETTEKLLIKEFGQVGIRSDRHQ